MRLWVAVCALLAAAVAASAQSVHRISVPGATGIDAPAITQLGNWEVTVSFDPARCEISCVYRLRRDRFGRAPAFDLLMPPAIAVRVLYGHRSATLAVDPARTQDPRLASGERPNFDLAILPTVRIERKPAIATAAAPRLDVPAASIPSRARPAAATLRI